MKYIFALTLIWFAGCQTERNTPLSTDKTSPPKKDTAQPTALDALSIKTKGAEIILSEEERVWELIPWTTNLQEATRLSAETDRPIFLFSMHGDLDGRC